MKLTELLPRVIISWQVILVTVAVVLYLFLIFYVARPRRRKRPAKFSSTGRSKKIAPPKVEETPEPPEGDELGLEKA